MLPRQQHNGKQGLQKDWRERRSLKSLKYREARQEGRLLKLSIEHTHTLAHTCPSMPCNTPTTQVH